MAGVGDGDADSADAWAEGAVGGGGGDVVGADEEAASALAHGVDGVCDEVVEDLADVVFEAEDRCGAGVAGFQTRMPVLLRRPW